MSISVIIPTYRRVHKLQACLQSLVAQKMQPAQVIVSYRKDDQESCALLETFQNQLPLTKVSIDIPGVVHAENAALKHIQSEIVAFIDDDGIAPADWISNINQIFSEKKDITGLGGPDFIFKEPELRKNVTTVGKISWYGKVIGNHHNKSSAQYVQTLKGTNMAFLTSQISMLDPVLNGSHSEGNGVFWELDFCLNVTKRGKKLFFDPRLEIKHDSDHSHVKPYPTIRSGAHNLIYVLLKHHSLPKKIIFLSYYILLGNTQLMGVARFLITALCGKPIHSIRMIYYSQKGLLLGIKTFLKERNNR